MTDQTTRAKILSLMASGALPAARPSIASIAHGQIATGQESPDGRCTICDEPGPQVTYTYLTGQIIRVHATSDALWQRERAS